MSPDLEKTVSAEGHLVDSGIMSQILDTIIRDGGSFDILDFDMGRDNEEPSRTRLLVRAGDTDVLHRILHKLSALGVVIDAERELETVPAEANKVVDDRFYSTTNHETFVRLNGDWVPVEKIRMDGVIVVDKHRAVCRKLRDVKKGDRIAVGLSGIKVVPDEIDRKRSDFGFMTAEVSSEKKVELAVARVADMIRAKDKKVVCVAGPVVIHTGGSDAMARLVRDGYIQAILAGNALAVHDIEAALCGTSLGVDVGSGLPVEGGHRNHMFAINTINRAGSIATAVKSGKITTGLMKELVDGNVPYVLAGSLRDDGPLPETITDMNEAQEKYAEILAGADIVIMLSTMLHSIATGNMLPARVFTICVDINPSVVTKLKDRGSHQTLGIVTDVGLFLHLLADRLCP